jgi:hypothetical protein
MEATYNGRKVYIVSISSTQDRFVIVSYHETKHHMFKLNLCDLTDVSASLLAEINKESF